MTIEQWPNDYRSNSQSKIDYVASSPTFLSEVDELSNYNLLSLQLKVTCILEAASDL